MIEEPLCGPTAFVLAGGGTKGSFEVGALQYLIATEGIVPDIITATSAGALGAVVLAQARTLPEFAHRVQQMEDDILAMTRTRYVFGEQPWLRALHGTSLGAEIMQSLTEGTRPPLPPGADFDYAPDRDRSWDAVDAERAPLTSRAQRRAERKAHRRARRRIVRLIAGAALRLPRARRKLQTSGSAVMNLQPLAEAMRRGGPTGIHPVDPTLIDRPGLQLRLAVTALRAGVLRYITESGIIVEEDAMTPVAGVAAGPVDVLEGALASASVPMVFPPRPLADDDYVDGGVLQNVPVRAALQLGASRIIAVLAIPLYISREEHNFSADQAANIGLRALGVISLADRQRENLGIALAPGASLTTIDPVVDVVGFFEAEVGLLRINRDYGWLRAADVMAEGDPTLRAEIAAQTHQIAEARLRAWHTEEKLWGTAPLGRGSEAGICALLRECKLAVRDLVDQRKQLGFPVPDGCEEWWTEYEVHDAEPPAHLPSRPLGV
jgi:predicted acylesterase/phospholipase RssA